MRDLTKRVMDGLENGKEVWVCHYNRPDLNKKPLRNIPPTKCLVKHISELPKNKTVYYSESFFAPIGKKGNVTAKVISPVDNTGYRSYCGNMLSTFDNESDCVCEWNDQLSIVEIKIQKNIDNATKAWELEKSNLIDMYK